MKKVAFLIFVASFFGLAVSATSASPEHGASRGSMKINGMKRKFLLHVPENYRKDSAVPLVIVLHGAFGSAKISRWDSRMSEQSEKDGFIVAYPCAAFGTWNAGLCCGISKRKKVNDVEFIAKLIAKLKNDFNIDPNKVYVAGVSNGGMMAYRLGRELSDEIAAICPIEGCMYQKDESTAQPVSVMVIHGTRDPVIPYDGGVGRWMGIKLKVPSVAYAINFWVGHDKCNSTPSKESDDKITKELYRNGQNSTEVCLYTIDGGGHIWPGGRRAFLTGRPQEKQFAATEIMCKFFWDHPKHLNAISKIEAAKLSSSESSKF